MHQYNRFHHEAGPHGSRGRRARHGGPRGWGGPRGPRARRGDVRAALLVLLAEEPRNGYQLMQAIEERSDGAWRPSPGSVYPTLQQLEDEGLVTAAERDGQRLFDLTEAGRQSVAERPEDAPAPWDVVAGGSAGGERELMKVVRDVATAAAQVVRAGNEQQVDEARQILAEANRSLYRILAGDSPDQGDTHA
jgi:DNA-binding PadR family transcriptional regulator